MSIRILLLALFLCLPNYVQAQPPLTFEAQQEAQKAERYLQSLESAQARFVQTNHDGAQLVGTFYLNRPGKLRFEYDPPIEDFIVADGLFLYFYDSELGEQSNVLIGQTLADFILRKNVKFGGDVRVDSVFENDKYVQVKLVQSDDVGAGSITLGFSQNPYALKKWRIVDPAGLITEVELFYLKENIIHPKGLFIYKNPNKSIGNNFNQ